MEAQEREDILSRLRDYLSSVRSLNAQTAEGRDEIDQGTMPLVLGLPKLYEDRSWVQELGAPKKAKKRGRIKPDSQDRFVKWLREKQEIQVGQPMVSRFFSAREVLNSYANGIEVQTTEGALRPLASFVYGKHPKGSQSDLVRLCRRAEALAAGGRVRRDHANQAIKELVEEQRKAIGPVSTEGVRTGKIERKADQIRSLMAELASEGPDGEREAWAIIGEYYRKLQPQAQTA
jgi:hypothetical protein